MEEITLAVSIHEEVAVATLVRTGGADFVLQIGTQRDADATLGGNVNTVAA